MFSPTPMPELNVFLMPECLHVRESKHALLDPDSSQVADEVAAAVAAAAAAAAR